MNEDIKRYMNLLEGKSVPEDKKFSTLIESTKQAEETVEETPLAEQLEAMMELDEEEVVVESEAINIPQNNSFAVYNEMNKKWWDPKKGWSDDLTVWKKSSFYTLITYTALSDYMRKQPRGSIKIINIFTGEDVSANFPKAFDYIYGKSR